MGESLVQQRSFEFALSIIRLYKKLQARQEFVLSPQLLRSGTGIGVKIEQAITELSPQSFVYQMSAASGEAIEARYWLKLLQASKLADIDVTAELHQVNEIIGILSTVIHDSQPQPGSGISSSE